VSLQSYDDLVQTDFLFEVVSKLVIPRSQMENQTGDHLVTIVINNGLNIVSFYQKSMFSLFDIFLWLGAFT
jgi:hypothetical protein